jgi:hypothetical protein
VRVPRRFGAVRAVDGGGDGVRGVAMAFGAEELAVAGHDDLQAGMPGEGLNGLGRQVGINPARNRELPYLLMGWSGRAPAPPAF